MGNRINRNLRKTRELISLKRPRVSKPTDLCGKALISMKIKQSRQLDHHPKNNKAKLSILSRRYIEQAGELTQKYQRD